MSAEKSPVDAGLNETNEKRFEELSQETQRRIVELCSKAGMDGVSLETLRHVLKNLNQTEVPKMPDGHNHGAILQNSREAIDKL